MVDCTLRSHGGTSCYKENVFICNINGVETLSEKTVLFMFPLLFGSLEGYFLSSQHSKKSCISSETFILLPLLECFI